MTGLQRLFPLLALLVYVFPSGGGAYAGETGSCDWVPGLGG
ncbi:hypothetical protein ACFCZ1_09995 [Streptomyces sp. NPDC056224]